MSRLNYKHLLQLYMIHVDGRARETFIDKRDAEWTDKEWSALVEIRNSIEEIDCQIAAERSATMIASPASAPA